VYDRAVLVGMQRADMIHLRWCVCGGSGNANEIALWKLSWAAS
jgi:hypothetical protein